MITDAAGVSAGAKRAEAERAARVVAMEKARREREDAHGRELLRWRSTQGREDFRKYEKEVLARRGEYDARLNRKLEVIRRRKTVYPAGGGTVVPDHPFKGWDASAAGVAKVRVTFGTVNSVIPTIYDVGTAAYVPMDTVPAPNLATPTDGVVCLRTYWTPGAEPLTLDSASVEFYASVPANTDTEGYQLLFTVDAGGGAVSAIYQAMTQSLFVEREKCGSGTATYYFGT